MSSWTVNCFDVYGHVMYNSGMSWEDWETPEQREKRELARLPQPEQLPNCSVYLKKDKATGKVLTVYDYNRKRKKRVGEEEEVEGEEKEETLDDDTLSMKKRRKIKKKIKVWFS